jgi:hypothetical protein
MNDLLLGEDYDLVLKNGDLVLTETKSQKVAQAITICLKTIQNEWFLNQDFGVPYLSILGQKPEELIFINILKEQILKVSDVLEVNLIETSFDSIKRALKINLHIKISDGSIVTFNHTLGFDAE